MIWTLEELRRSHAIKETERSLFDLMMAAGKTRFGVARNYESYNQPCLQGYGIALELDHPHCDIIYRHELFHGILLEENYPTAWSGERPESEEVTGTILWNFTNTVHHVEIFDRMARCGANLEHYFDHRAKEMMRKVQGIVETGDSTFASRNMDVLVLFDIFLMGKQGEVVQAAYRRHATRSLDACREIYNKVRQIGCASPEAALDSARVFQTVMARYCRLYGAPERFATFWDSIKYSTLGERGDLQNCPSWVKPFEHSSRRQPTSIVASEGTYSEAECPFEPVALNGQTPDVTPEATYSHTQKAPLCLILYGFAVACFVLVWLIGETPGIYIGGGVGLLIALIGPCFHHLTVENQGDLLAIRFGPIPLFKRTVRYADIGSVEIGRTLLLDGWGIHYRIRGGWVWNLWGRTCVVVHFKNGGTLRIGTDDAENLVEFLRGKVQA